LTIHFVTFRAIERSGDSWTDRYKLLRAGCFVHSCVPIWSRPTKWFWRDDGSNFGLFRWVDITTLSHYRASVWFSWLKF